MYFCHLPEIWDDFPSLVPGIMVVERIRPHVEQGPNLAFWLGRARERLRDASESQMEEIMAWRQAYSKMGLKPSQYRSAAEALLRRFRKEDSLPSLHPAVDVCNAISVAFALPVAILDIAKLDSFVEVCRAKGDEAYLSFSGETEHPYPGEVIFRDASKHAHARRWTFRQSRLSTVGPETDHALVVSEALHRKASEDIPALLEALSRELTALGATVRSATVLTAVAPRLEF
jgi:DNA/RNA-binding domain of Phe-tRNA-synthetase-like protein